MIKDENKKLDKGIARNSKKMPHQSDQVAKQLHLIFKARILLYVSFHDDCLYFKAAASVENPIF